MDVREKLIELIAQKVCDTWSESCDEWLPHDCGKCYANDCHISELADHLISNGVTVQEWIPVNEHCAYIGITSLVADVNVNEIADHIRNGNLASWVKSWQQQMAFELENLKLSEKD